MIDKRMIDDPFIQSAIYQSIRNRINEAKVGVLKVHGIIPSCLETHLHYAKAYSG